MGSKLNYLVRGPILFVGCPWRATADLVRERVFKKIIAVILDTYNPQLLTLLRTTWHALL